MREQPKIAYYISAHGFGHAARSCDIIRFLNEAFPEIHTTVISGLPRGFFENRLAAGVNSFRSGTFDVGMVQIDSVRVDVESTLERIEELYSRRVELVSREALFLEKERIGLVVADVPAIPLEAAARAGISRIAVGNFAWDWIYSAYVERNRRWAPVVEAFREGYAQADLLLRFPFCDAMKAFRHIADIPLVASPGRDRRREIAAASGSPADSKWILLSFSSLDLDEEAYARLAQLEGYRFFTVLPLAWSARSIQCLDPARFRFSDVVASVDAVVSKPGFGILSECIANRKPLIYVERNDFIEYPILESAIKKYLKHVWIPSSRLYGGDLGEALEEIWVRPEPESSLPLGGAAVAGRMIADLLKVRSECPGTTDW